MVSAVGVLARALSNALGLGKLMRAAFGTGCAREVSCGDRCVSRQARPPRSSDCLACVKHSTQIVGCINFGRAQMRGLRQ